MAVFTTQSLGRQGTMADDNEPTVEAPHHVWGKDANGLTTLLYATGDPIPESRAAELGIKPGKAQAKVAEPEGKVQAPAENKTRAPRAPRKRAAAKPKE